MLILRAMQPGAAFLHRKPNQFNISTGESLRSEEPALEGFIAGFSLGFGNKRNAFSFCVLAVFCVSDLELKMKDSCQTCILVLPNTSDFISLVVSAEVMGKYLSSSIWFYLK